MNDATMLILVIFGLALAVCVVAYLVLSLRGHKRKIENERDESVIKPVLRDKTKEDKGHLRTNFPSKEGSRTVTTINPLYQYSEGYSQCWTCRFCGCENDLSLDHCEVCNKEKNKGM